jgi:mono/diheme cytochrome c family protein
MLRAVVLCLLLLVSVGCSVSRPEEDASGEEIYRLLCSNCHAEDMGGGALGPSLGPGSNSATQPDAFIEFAIVNGKGSMPSFGNVLNDRQVDRLVDYIRQVQAR